MSSQTATRRLTKRSFTPRKVAINPIFTVIVYTEVAAIDEYPFFF